MAHDCNQDLPRRAGVTPSAKGGLDDEGWSQRDLPVEPVQQHNAQPRPRVVLLSEVQAESVEWLWPGRLPLGKLTFLEGDPDVGKSCVAFDLAARVSTGQPMPGEVTWREPAGAVIISAEDGLADTIKPRLEAAGADLTRIAAFALEDLPAIPGSINEIESAIAVVDARLVIVDPVMALLSPAIDAHKDQHVRRALTPLAALAEQRRTAFLLLRHLNKSTGTNAKYRGGGSIGMTAAARSAMLAAIDPNDDTRRVLARIKGNLGEPWPSMGYRLVRADQSVCVEWLGATAHSSAELLAQPADNEERSALEEAKRFLSAELATGPRPSKEIARAAREAGIADITLRRAREQLRVRWDKGGPHGSYLLSLPTQAIGARVLDHRGAHD